jgi:hypothetical protein
MANRMDIVTPRAGSDGKTYFTKIGSAWETKSGGWSLSFDALPTASMNDKGQLETRALLMVPRERDGGGTNPSVRQSFGNGGGQAARNLARGGFDDDLDDDPGVPF